MARITGITIEKDKSGNARYARIDLKKYGMQLRAFFQELGMQDEVSTYDPKFVAKSNAVRSKLSKEKYKD